MLKRQAALNAKDVAANKAVDIKEIVKEEVEKRL